MLNLIILIMANFIIFERLGMVELFQDWWVQQEGVKHASEQFLSCHLEEKTPWEGTIIK